MSRGIARYAQTSPLGLQLTDDVAKKLKGRIPADAFGKRLFDRKRFKPGAVTPTSTIRFFNAGIGDQDFVVNAPSEAYAKTETDTNLDGGARLPADQRMIVQSIQAMVTVTAATDTTYPTTGAGTELPTDTAAAAAVAAANLTNAILSQGYMVFFVGKAEYEDGLLLHFPSRYGLSGFSGFGVATNFEGVVNNGFGQPYTLPIERQIPELINFGVELRFVQGLSISRQFTITMVLEGIMKRRVQ